ncbi:K02A2.6-like [Cordylochernes scorpioides]|uniref:RNA-directed DNA polymerase n=1 Tax=Cordylochernes scorpioides TaxID=51811 RepID=A0ABY6KZM9_9ARAC|nr:K02A2.6-like [Cordylochernes scorpioides]
MSSQKRKRELITIEEKKEICQLARNNPTMSKNEIGERFSLPRTTVRDILTQAEKWENYTRFKGKFHISQRRLCGEGASISPAIIDKHLTNLNSILANSGYDPTNIYTADETGLFFQLIPDRTLAHKDENCRGVKRMKQQITVLLCYNSTGTDKRRLLIIGKSAKPRCFRNFSPHFYCTYTSNSKAWMTSSIFQDWLLQFKKQLVSEGRCILLLLDNATSHCVPNDGLSNIKIHFAITPENLMTEREFQLVDDSQKAEMKLTDDNLLVSTVTAKEELGEDDDTTVIQRLLSLREARTAAETVLLFLEHSKRATSDDLNLSADLLRRVYAISEGEKRQVVITDFFKKIIKVDKDFHKRLKPTIVAESVSLKNVVITRLTFHPTDATKWFHIAASIEQNRASIHFKPKNKIHLATKNNDNRKNVCPFWCPICSKKGIKIKHWVTDCEDYDPNYKKDKPNQNTSVKQVCGAPELLNVSTLTNTPTQGAFKLINISVEVNGIPAQAFVDTGATVSIINWRLFKRTHLQLQPNSDIHISQADGVTRTCESLQTKVRIDKLIKPVTLHVMRNFKYPLLIGLDVASLFNLLIGVKDKTIYPKFDGLQNPILVNHLEEIREHELKKILEHNRNVFCQHAIDLGKVAIQHKIITKSEQPISLRPYRRPLKEYEEIAEQVKELLEHKLIRISDSPWAFPVVMVPKKDGNKRMCIDYRRLNEITLDDRQPLPHIQDMFDRLHGSRFFSTLDVAWGYWQIEMDPQSIQKTAFVTNDGKVKSIQDIPRPDTVKKVRQFMGLANYYRKFVKDFSKISFPLVRLTLKNQPFIWNEEVEESLAKLKMALSTKPVLAIYNPDYPSKVYTDASKYGIGAILTQIGPDNEEHVIAYYSKTLQPHQDNYSAYEMECLAVIQATDHFHVYIENQPFEIITDHAALQWLFTMKKPLPVVNIATQELQEHQQNSDLSFLKNSHTHEGVVMIKQKGVFKAVVPNSLTKKILEEYHDSLSHPSITKTCKLITQCYWWKGITTDIKNYVRSCKSCQLVKVRHEPTLGEMITPTSNIQPLQMIGCDTIELGTAAANTKHKFIQVFVDHATRYLWAYPTITNTAQAVTHCLDKIIKSVNLINTILTDNGKNFISKEFNKFLSLQGIKHTYTSPYHPQCNGICEKLNDTIMTKLRIAVLEKPRCKWSTLLPQVVKNYNSTPHDVTGFSSLFLMYGIGNVSEFADQTPITMEEARKKASLRTEQIRSKWKIKHDSHHPKYLFEMAHTTVITLKEENNMLNVKFDAQLNFAICELGQMKVELETIREKLVKKIKEAHCTGYLFEQLAIKG